MTDRDGNLEIYAVDDDGANQVNLTNDPAQDGSPTFTAAPRTATVAVPRAAPEPSNPIRLTASPVPSPNPPGLGSVLTQVPEIGRYARRRFAPSPRNS